MSPSGGLQVDLSIRFTPWQDAQHFQGSHRGVIAKADAPVSHAQPPLTGGTSQPLNIALSGGRKAIQGIENA